jgi:hypothetical protein
LISKLLLKSVVAMTRKMKGGEKDARATNTKSAKS